jgi:hypothetical protein
LLDIEIDYSTMFAFVDGLSSSYQSKAIRSHVMTNAYNAKKNRRRVPERETTTWTLELVTRPSTPRFSPSPNAISDASAPETNHNDIWTLNHPSMQPRTILGAGLIDHFSTLPVPRTEVIDEFVAACSSPCQLIPVQVII